MKKHVKTKAALMSAVLFGSMVLSMGNMSKVMAAIPVSQVEQASQMKRASIGEVSEDSRVFKIDKDIEIKMVHFKNRYGFEVAGHMYLPRDFNINKQYKAVVVTGPFGAVKEQVSGLYAQELAKNGFVAVAFDPSMTGESSGERRNMGSPEIFTEDYSAAIDFVSNLKFVNSKEVGAIGICGLAGMALTAASNDTRIRAVATVSMYDMSESISDHYKGEYYTPVQREKVKEHLAMMRDQEAKIGKYIPGAHELSVNSKGNVETYTTMFPDKLPIGVNDVIRNFYDYYVGRAYHPRSVNSNTSAWDATTPYGFFNFKLMENIDEIGQRPVLLITGDKAHSKYFSDNIYQNLKGSKEKIVVPNATHVDLYDQMDKIPFTKLVSFFKSNLK